MKEGNFKGEKTTALIKVEDGNKKGNDEEVHDLISKFFSFLGKLLKKGNSNFFMIEKEGREPIKITLTITAIMFMITFWITTVILILGLFYGYRYSFVGPDFAKKTRQ